MSKPKSFYAGVKAFEKWHQERAGYVIACSEGASEAMARLCPYLEQTPEWDSFEDGFLFASDAEATEDYVDTTQLSYEQVDEFTRHNPDDDTI